jgi:uncharacterized protein YwqG
MSTPLPTTPDELCEQLIAAGYTGDKFERLVEDARPAISLITEPVADEVIAIGASKIGGAPDLPRGMAWPMRPAYPHAADLARDREWRAQRLIDDAAKPGAWLTAEQATTFAADHRAGAAAVAREFPLAFIAQIDLATMAREPGFDGTLPETGRLLFFFDYWNTPAEFLPGSRVGWRLIWDASPAAELERKAFPPELVSISTESWTTVFKSARITPRSVLTPMALGAVAIDPAVQAAQLDYNPWLDTFGLPDGHHDNTHRLGGWPTPLQNGWQGRPQLAFHGIDCGRSEAYETPEAIALLENKGDWQLVLQIGCDSDIGLLPEGSGCMLVMMRRQDLRDRAFDRAWVVYQCT